MIRSVRKNPATNPEYACITVPFIVLFSFLICAAVLCCVSRAAWLEASLRIPTRRTAARESPVNLSVNATSSPRY